MTATLTQPLPSVRSHRRGSVRVAAALFLLLAATSALGAIFGLLVLLGLAAVFTWRYPAWAAVALVALVPINRFLILLVFHYGHSRSITVLTQAWKDLLIGVLFVRAVDEIVMGRRPKLHFVDLLVAAYLVISLVYLFAYAGDTGRVGFTDRLLGFRADSYFMLAYFVGRWIVFERRHLYWLLVSLLPGTVVVAIVAGAQFARPTWFNRLFEHLSFSAFINGQGGFGDVDVIRNRGISGVDLPRASSLLLGDLALAFFSILAVAVAAAVLLTARRRVSRLIAGSAVVLAVASIAFSVTRSAAIAAAVTLLLMAVLARGLMRVATVGATLFIAALLALTSGFVPLKAVGALTNPHEASVQAHGSAIENGLALVREQPLGRGLGTSGTIGQRVFREEAVTPENWYLQIGTEMGVVPALLFIGFSVAVLIEALVSFWRVRDLALSRIALAVAGGSVGFLILGNMLHVWEVPVISMAFWLLAGIAVGARDVEHDAAYEESR